MRLEMIKIRFEYKKKKLRDMSIFMFDLFNEKLKRNIVLFKIRTLKCQFICSM